MPARLAAYDLARMPVVGDVGTLPVADLFDPVIGLLPPRPGQVLVGAAPGDYLCTYDDLAVTCAQETLHPEGVSQVREASTADLVWWSRSQPRLLFKGSRADLLGDNGSVEEFHEAGNLPQRQIALGESSAFFVSSQRLTRRDYVGAATTVAHDNAPFAIPRLSAAANGPRCGFIRGTGADSCIASITAESGKIDVGANVSCSESLIALGGEFVFVADRKDDTLRVFRAQAPYEETLLESEIEVDVMRATADGGLYFAGSQGGSRFIRRLSPVRP
jgi:hypothetical protein